MGVGEAVARAMNILVGIRFQMMKAMIPYPGYRIACQTNRGAGSEKELKPARHLKPAMSKIAMEIKGSA